MKIGTAITLFFLGSLGLQLRSQVSPLLSTTWNQGCNYNAQCPTTGSGGACGRVWTGCGATAFSQVLKYHSYPASGWSGNYCNSVFPAHCVDVGSQTYLYASMPNSLSGPNAEVAKLMYHMGIILDMAWSGSNSTSGPTAGHLKKFWRYSLSAKGALKALYTNTQWENLIKNELDAGRVITASGGAHIYLIDGYQTSPSLKFHVNFGWGGLYDGYYDIHNIVAGGNNYTPGTIITGIKPLVSQVETTTDTIIVTASASSFNSFELAALNNWTLSSNQTWLTPNLSSGNAGYFNNQNGATFSVTANMSYSPRYGTITANSGASSSSFVVKQLGIQPSLSVSNNSLTYSSAASGQNVSIFCDSNWVASSADAWISIVPASGSGNGSITINVSANGPAARNGTVTVTRGNLQQNISVYQASNSSFWCTPAMTISGTNGITNVTLKTINRTSPQGEGYIYTGLSTTLKIDTSYTVFVTFPGGTPSLVAPAVWIDWNIDGDFNDPGEAVVSPSGTWYPSNAGVKSQAFTVPSNAVEGTTRMRVYAKNFGTGPVTSPCNTTDVGGDIEDYDIIIKNHKNIEVNPTSLNYLSGGGSQSVSVSSDSIWTASCPASWVSFSPASGNGNGVSNIIVSANSGTTLSRTAVATFTRGNKFKTVNISQAGEDTLLNAIDTSITISAIGGSYLITTNANVTYSISASQPWITLSSTSETGNSIFYISAGLNSNTFALNGYVVLNSGTYSDTVFVTQSANSTTLNVSPLVLNYPSGGGMQTASITTSGSWNAIISDPWISVDQNMGTGNYTLQVTLTANAGGSRSGSVDITNGILTQTILINQAGVTGIAEQNQNSPEAMLLFPNPANERLTIKFETSNRRVLQIHSADGKLMRTDNIETNETTLNISNLENGLYFVTIINGESILKSKFIIQR